MKTILNLPALFISLTCLACTPLPVLAQEGIVKSIKILEALTSKDIVLDRTGSSGGQSNQLSANRALAIDLQVQFAFNSADPQPLGRQQLDELAMALADQALRAHGFDVIGHTDRVGSADYNAQLSLERAVTVKNYLITSHGISPMRLRVAGMGFSQLADPSNPSAAINRRVEIRRVGLSAGSTYVAPAPGGRLVPTP